MLSFRLGQPRGADQGNLGLVSAEAYVISLDDGWASGRVTAIRAAQRVPMSSDSALLHGYFVPGPRSREPHRNPRLCSSPRYPTGILSSPPPQLTAVGPHTTDVSRGRPTDDAATYMIRQIEVHASRLLPASSICKPCPLYTLSSTDE